MNTEEKNLLTSTISDYARSWSLLQAYDEQSLKNIDLQHDNMQSISLELAIEGIEQLKQTLIEKGEASELFGLLRGDGLASALGTIEQGFGNQLYYPNIASRAAHLLYFMVKNHPLADGNKRSGAFLFLWYLRINQSFLIKPIEEIINDNALVALTLLVAQSIPDQKDLIIKLIESFITMA